MLKCYKLSDNLFVPLICLKYLINQIKNLKSGRIIVVQGEKSRQISGIVFEIQRLLQLHFNLLLHLIHFTPTTRWKAVVYELLEKSYRLIYISSKYLKSGQVE